MHPCAIEGCPEQISFELLMCSGHWRQVSPTTKREVNDCWRAVRTARMSAAALQAITNHRAAKQKAIDEVRGFSQPALI